MALRSKTLVKHLQQLLLLFIIFHLTWLLGYLLSYSLVLKSGNFHVYLKYSLINTLGFIAFCTAAFWIFPFFLSRQKYMGLVIVSLLVIVTMGYGQFLLQDWNPTPFSQTAGGKRSMPMAVLSQSNGAAARAMFNVATYLLLGIGYAYMKDWFIKDRRARTLEKEKTAAELMLLRYQLNPHFLFNTINDIYYLALIKSDKTPDALLKISNLLRYVLNEKEAMVSLDKEIEHLKHLTELHQFRFPDHVMRQQMQFSQDISTLQIAPLLLVTFAENAFKHGEPGTSDHPVAFCIDVHENVLQYKVVNRINYNNSKDAATGIGLNNLSRRLTLLYPGTHELKLEEKDGIYSAFLKINLS